MKKSLQALALLGGILPTGLALAANPTISVNWPTDSQDGRCDSTGTSNRCNLRAAVAYADTLTGEVAIRLDTNNKDNVVTLGPIALNPSSPKTYIIFGGTSTNIKGGSGTLFDIGENAKVSLHHLAISNFNSSFSASVVKNQGQLTIALSSFVDNKSECSSQGIQSASALCYSPTVIDSTGHLSLNSVYFARNISKGYAYNAASTSATSSTAAVASRGSLTFDGPVTFEENASVAVSNAVPRSTLPTNARATAGTGALYVLGNLNITSKGKGKCSFIRNRSEASASAPSGDAQAVIGTAGVYFEAAYLHEPITDACRFEGNVGEDVAGAYFIDQDTVHPLPVDPYIAAIRTDIDYSLVSLHSGKCLDVRDFGTQNGAGTQQWDCSNTDNQKFRFVNEGHEQFSLVGKASQRCLSAYAVQTENGTPAVIWDCHSGPDQILQPAYSNGSYEFHFSHSNKCLDVSGPSLDNGAGVHQWECWGGANQKWQLVPAN